VIRPATPDDLEAIMALERASFPTDAWSDAMMREELASPHGRYVVLEDDGAFTGYAGLRSVAGAADADVQTIAVAEAARGRGSGRMLLRTLIGIAHERRVRDLFLEVRDDNPVAQRLYASEGFVETGRRPRYYQPDDVDAIVMTLDVRGWAALRGESASRNPGISPDPDAVAASAPRPVASPKAVASPNPVTHGAAASPPSQGMAAPDLGGARS
jgi:ribosomal-protein-alanine acetyltransferase